MRGIVLSRERIGNQTVVQVSNATDNHGAQFVFHDNGMNICIFKENEWSGFSISKQEASKIIKLMSKTNKSKTRPGQFLRAKSHK